MSCGRCHVCAEGSVSGSLPIYIYPELSEALVGATQALGDGDFTTARENLSRARALNAKVWRRSNRLARLSNADWAQQQGATPETSSQFVEVTRQIRVFWAVVARWLDTFIASAGRGELLKTDEGINILLDRFLPFHWDANQDIVIFSGPNSDDFVSVMVARNQLQMVVVRDLDPDEDDLIKRLPLPNCSPESSIKTALILNVKKDEVLSIKQLAALRNIEPPGFVSIPTDADGDEFDGFEPLKNQMIARFVQQFSQRHWPTIFAQAILKNLPYIYNFRSVCDVKPFFENKNMMIVSPGPSLLDSISNIVTYREKFVLVSLVRSLPVLFDYGIVPDFAMLVDASDHTSERLNIIPDHPLLKEVPLIISEFAHRTSYESDFKEKIVLPSSGLIGSPISLVLHGEKPPLVVGGSVANQATVLCVELGAKSVTLVGQDLCVSESGEAYASKTQKRLKTADHVTCLGINGEQLPTQADYKHFAREFEIIARNYSKHPVMLFNSTAHGAYLHYWEHIPLDAEHPAIAQPAEDDIDSLGGLSIADGSEVRLTARERILGAISDELLQLTQIDVLLTPIIQELHKLLADRSEDTSFLEALEHELVAALTTDGSITKFYTSPAKLEAGVSLEANVILQENLIVSLDYYLAIEAGVHRLRTLFSETQSAIEVQKV